MRRRKLGDGAGEKSLGGGVLGGGVLESRRYEEPFASMVVGAVRRLISMPMKAKGAQQARAQGL